jgi:hypothetical protein
MPPIFASLPGLPMPVAEVTTALAHMWDAAPGTDGRPPADFRASQMNLVLHFGVATEADEGQRLFASTLALARRYPCRIIVLCPAPDADGQRQFQAKLFSQCYIGPQQRDYCCCEALILGYDRAEADFLESQVSLWLEADLPVCHWFIRVPAERIQAAYLPFIRDCRRVLYDSAIEATDIAAMPWPQPARVRDLAFVRTLPLRRQIGQFCAALPPQRLAAGLAGTSLRHQAGHAAEARLLAAWQDAALAACARQAGVAPPPPTILTVAEPHAPTLAAAWTYDAGAYLHWEYTAAGGHGHIRARFNGSLHEACLRIEPLAPEAALAEALFF